MKILLLGGTGAMGKHLVHYLEQRDDIKMFVTSRSEKVSSDKTVYLKGNAKDLQFLNEILAYEKWDAIVDFMVYSTEQFKERVSLLLRATKQYLFLSSARVYANSDVPIKESSARLLETSNDKEFLATDDYPLQKARQEDVLRNSDLENWTIIRPYITYSEQRLQLGVLEKEGWLYRAFKGRSIVFSAEMMTRKTTMTYGEDVSRAIATIIGDKDAYGKAFHITESSAKTWGEILNLYLRVFGEYYGFTPKVVLLDTDSFLTCYKEKYPVYYDRLYDRSFDNSEINQLVDTSDFYSVESGLKKSINEFMKTAEFGHIDWVLQAQFDKMAKEYTPLKEIKGFKRKLWYFRLRYLPQRKKR